MTQTRVLRGYNCCYRYFGLSVAKDCYVYLKYIYFNPSYSFILNIESFLTGSSNENNSLLFAFNLVVAAVVLFLF